MDPVASLFSLFRVEWMMPSSVREILLDWHGDFVGKTYKRAWSITTVCLSRTIWKERNHGSFENEQIKC